MSCTHAQCEAGPGSERACQGPWLRAGIGDGGTLHLLGLVGPPAAGPYWAWQPDWTCPTRILKLIPGAGPWKSCAQLAPACSEQGWYGASLEDTLGALQDTRLQRWGTLAVRVPRHSRGLSAPPGEGERAFSTARNFSRLKGRSASSRPTPALKA